MPHKTVSDVRIAYDDRGEGLPIVFIHGFPLSRQMWRHQLEALSERWRTIALDLPGFRESSKPKEYSIKSLAKYVVDFMEKIDARPAIIAGHSMGGYILFEIVRRFPGSVLSMILVNTRAEADTEEARERRMRAIKRIRDEGKEAFLREFLPQLLAPKNRGKLLGELEEICMGVSEEVLVETLKALAERPDNTDLLPKIKAPALIVAGKEDPLVPPESSLTMARMIPKSALAVLSDTGHLSPLEAPEKFNEAVSRFIMSLESG